MWQVYLKRTMFAVRSLAIILFKNQGIILFYFIIIIIIIITITIICLTKLLPINL